MNQRIPQPPRRRPTCGPREAGTGPRFMLYSHDSAGLGHLRRNLTLAAALGRAFPEGMVILVTGSACATCFPLPPRVELVKLPSIGKNEAGAYVSRNLPTSVNFNLRIRRGLLLEVMQTYQPHLLIVDHQVVGLRGEVLPLLEYAQGHDIRTILGLRDIIDSPEAVAHEWSTDDHRWALAEGYDRVCVYGSPELFDPRIEYPIPPILASRVEFCGYVVRDITHVRPSPVPTARPEVLVTVGGGEDGAEKIHTYLECIEKQRPEWDSVIVTGPLLSTAKMRELSRRARLVGGTQLHRFHADLPRLLQRADVVLSMAGYNTCSEIMALGKRAVLLPRTWPRQEQAIRAERMSRLGLARGMTGRDPIALRRALEEELERDPSPLAPPPLDGADRMASIAASLLDVPVTTGVVRLAEEEIVT